MSTVIARQVTKGIVPIMLLVACSFLLQGHNLPGGGFIAGVLVAAAIGLVYIVFDFDGIATLFGLHDRQQYQFVPAYTTGIASGLLLAAGSGLAAVAFNTPFLTQTHGTHWIPLLGKRHLSTAVIFDLGVFLVVVNGLLLMLEVLGEE